MVGPTEAIKHRCFTENWLTLLDLEAGECTFIDVGEKLKFTR
jgi:hypothetical protein